MKYLDISYSRLFSLGIEHGNESFDLHVKLGVGDKADEVMGKLFIKVAQMEAVFEKYRQTLRTINRVTGSVNFEITRIEQMQNDIEYNRSKLKEMTKGEEYTYSEDVIKEMVKGRQERQDIVVNLRVRLEALRNTRKLLREAIKEGNFNVEV